jgi:hypothetical protein
VDGFVFEVGQFDPPLSTIKRISEYARAKGIRALINVRLAPEDPATYPRDHNYIANRVAETIVASYSYPRVKILLDTFMDHDRGYFPRAGLYDRRLNPRKAALVLRHLNSAINIHGTNITPAIKETTNGWTVITFHSSRTIYNLYLPHTIDAQIHEKESTSIDLITGTINTRKIPKGKQHLAIKSL